jgi:iron(III) transport system ATP-binding protein
MEKERCLLELSGVSKYYGQNQVVDDVSFALAKGDIGCLLGPSGCGKTTLLRVVAGFESVQQGRVIIDGLTVSAAGYSIAPEKRSIGMVFQDYALFPHMTVTENTLFGIGRWSRQCQRDKLNQMLELVGLENHADRYPHELSGGQQQRVALARALAPEPALLLLDEPFSNLDALLRERLTVEVRDILKELGTTALMVTHNQHEAFSVADRIGVLFHGQMQQWDTAHTIYHRPASLEVATFVGDGVIVRGTVVGPDMVESGLGLLQGNLSLPCVSGCEVDLLVRPEDVLHVDNSPLQAKILHKSFRGPNILYQLQLPTGEHCQSLVSSHHNHAIGELIGIRPEVDNLVAFPAKTENL